MNRRTLMAGPIVGFFVPQATSAESPDDRVYVTGDGIPHSPAEYSRLLAGLEIEADDYSRGGAVQRFEERMAAMLGKETAVWLPTGTLANHLAVRLLATDRRRVLVQAESHLFNDCGDCAQTLSGLTLVPLAPGKATFTLDDVEHAVALGNSGRVATPIGAIQIESPVRRRFGECFDFAEMARISRWAREHRVGLHLDGARIFIESAYTGRSVKEYAALFDTVYVSAYKYFNAASGAILAGPKALLGELYHTRRMFGGGLAQSWPLTAVALHYADQFEASFRKAKEASDSVLTALGKDSNYTITPIPNGTNIFRFQVFGVNPPVYRERLELAGVIAAPPDGVFINMRVNPTWTRVPPEEIVARFRKGMG